MSQPRVPKCYPKGFIPPCWSPKPTPMSQPHVPTCPSVTLKVSFHHAGPLNPPPCPSPVSPSVALKVSFHHAGYSSLNHQHSDWWFCWSYLCGSKWRFLVLSDPVVLSDPNPWVLSDPPTILYHICGISLGAGICPADCICMQWNWSCKTFRALLHQQ